MRNASVTTHSARRRHATDAYNAAHPARWSFFIRDDDPKWTFAGFQQLAVLLIGKQHRAVGEARIEFGERECNSIAVTGFDKDVLRECRTAQRVACGPADQSKDV